MSACHGKQDEGILDLRFPIFDLMESVRHCVDLRLLVIVHIRVRRGVKRSGFAILGQEPDKPLSHPWASLIVHATGRERDQG